ncbi:MAG: arginase family protein, partial [Hyphomicrobiales bacterium]
YGFDVVEVSPDFDVKSGITSTLAARIMVEAVCCLAAPRCGKVGAWDYRPT